MAEPITVSVIMPVYNRSRYLEEAARSVLDGSLREIELIAVDDGSTDESPAILDRLAKSDSRMIVIHQPNAGAYAARNAGAGCVRGRYLAMLDADDAALPDRLATQVATMDARPNLAALGGGWIAIGPSGREVRTVRPPVGPEVTAALPHFNPIHTAAVMIRRSAFEEVHGFRTLFRAGGDYDLWLRLAERYEVDNLPEPLAKYRIHGDQISSKGLSSQLAGMLASRESARLRREGKSDPLDHAVAITPEVLAELGVNAGHLRAAEFEARLWWADLMCEVGFADSAAMLLAGAGELAAQEAAATKPMTARVCRAWAQMHTTLRHPARRFAAKAAARLLERGWASPSMAYRLAAAGMGASAV